MYKGLEVDLSYYDGDKSDLVNAYNFLEKNSNLVENNDWDKIYEQYWDYPISNLALILRQDRSYALF